MTAEAVVIECATPFALTRREQTPAANPAHPGMPVPPPLRRCRTRRRSVAKTTLGLPWRTVHAMACSSHHAVTTLSGAPRFCHRKRASLNASAIAAEKLRQQRRDPCTRTAPRRAPACRAATSGQSVGETAAAMPIARRNSVAPSRAHCGRAPCRGRRAGAARTCCLASLARRCGGRPPPHHPRPAAARAARRHCARSAPTAAPGPASGGSSPGRLHVTQQRLRRAEVEVRLSGARRGPAPARWSDGAVAPPR